VASRGLTLFGSATRSGENSYPDGVPEVYVQWRLQRHVPVQGAYLSVKLGPRPAETMPLLLNAPGGIDSPGSPLGDR
jgi:hypothetical protein